MILYGKLRKCKKDRVWHNTSTLIEKVKERMDELENYYGDRRCPINNKHQLQIRGKHLRRLLKKKSNWELRGSCIVENNMT